VSSRSGEAEIWAADGEGRHATRVTVLQGPRPASPRFSPDATRIAFASAHRGQHDVFVANADGSYLRRLTAGPWEDSNASWSADGRFIYFRSNRGGLNQIWRMPSEGGTASLVTRGEASQARESSDGRTVYFVRGAIAPGLWSVPVSGGSETFVVRDVQEGSWDLTDKGVYFLPRNTDPSAPQPVRVLDLQTHRVGDIATLEGVRTIWPGFGASRDGRSIVWARQDRGLAEVMLLDPWVPAANAAGSQVADR
jgi:dipeptidyl aminopeptidase/acylaminoacyl peptidase